MKKNLLIAVLTVIGMITTAQVKASELNLKMFDNTLISVSVDNGPFTTPAPYVNFKHLPKGYHMITVYHIPDLPNRCGNGQEMVFSDRVYMPVMVEMNAAINRFGQFKIHSIIPKNQQVPVCNTTCPPQGYCGYNHNCTPAPNSNYYDYGYNQNVFNNTDFDALRYTIEQQSFDQTRLTVARQAIQSRMLSTAQVAELIRLFSFESTKLDFAKFAYDRTYDRDKYYLINNEFSFSSTIDELANFINRG